MVSNNYNIFCKETKRPIEKNIVKGIRCGVEVGKGEGMAWCWYGVVLCFCMAWCKVLYGFLLSCLSLRLGGTSLG